jgi:hypothetical protein
VLTLFVGFIFLVRVFEGLSLAEISLALVSGAFN